MKVTETYVNLEEAGQVGDLVFVYNVHNSNIAMVYDKTTEKRLCTLQIFEGKLYIEPENGTFQIDSKCGFNEDMPNIVLTPKPEEE